jgi:hypothetical protein
MEYTIILRNYLDSENRLKAYPTKRRLKMISLMYLAGQFEKNRNYTEKEINEVLNQFHTFNDPCILRRELYMNNFLNRKADGSEYRLAEKQPVLADFGLE